MPAPVNTQSNSNHPESQQAIPNEVKSSMVVSANQGLAAVVELAGRFLIEKQLF